VITPLSDDLTGQQVMTICISELKGVTAEIAAALRAIGINNSAQLLAASGRPEERADLAMTLGMDAGTLLELANRADLVRIHGLTRADLDLLLAAGVDSVMELRRRIPENLYARMAKIAEHRSWQRAPGLNEVQRWVSEAKRLERAIYY
jgi:hypothetical protein